MKPLLPTLLLALLAQPALAHPDASAQGSFAHGLLHPLLGPDHLLVMLAVGLWAARLGQNALRALPTAFLTGMAGGYGLALAGLHLPGVEPMILASVIILGAVLATATRLPLPQAAPLILTLGMFHGNAHGAELGTNGVLTFGIGFLLATAVLHGTGVTLARRLLRADAGANLLRALGVATLAAGAIMALTPA